MIYLPLKELLDLSDSGVWGDEDTESGISVLRSTNFRSNGTLDFTKLSFRAVEERKRSAKTLEVGDILLEKSGGGPQQPVGRVCLYRGHVIPHSFGNFIARLRPKDQILSEFLFYFLWYFHAIGKTSHYQKQTTGIRNLETQRFFTIDVPVPPLPEQRRIVDLLSRADGIVRLRREAQKKAAELIPAIFLEMFGDPRTNPKGWPVQPLGEVAAFISGGTPPKAREELWSGTLPWVSPKDMKVDCIADAIDHVSDSVLTATNLKLVPIGSILIVVRGMILVHTVPIAITSTPVTINQDMKALMPIKSIDPSFLLWALKVQHPKLLALVDTAAHGTKKLDTEKIQAVGIPVPPLQIQQQFIARADSVASIIAQQAEASSMAKASFDALLANVFAEV